MKTSTQLANRIREVFLSGTWIANTNYKHQLDNVTWSKAVIKINGLNTILSLSYHINYYLSGVLQVFEGGLLTIRDKYSFDHQSINSEETWNQLLSNMWSNAEQFAAHVENLSEAQLNEHFVDEKYGDYRRNIEGIIEHSYYHLGQISLIIKMIDLQEK